MLADKTKWLKSREEGWKMDKRKWSSGIQILKLLDMNIKRTMINMLKETDDKWKIYQKTGICFKKKKCKKQIKIENLKNTITGTDLLQYDGVRRLANLPIKQLQNWSKLSKSINSAL